MSLSLNNKYIQKDEVVSVMIIRNGGLVRTQTTTKLKCYPTEQVIKTDHREIVTYKGTKISSIIKLEKTTVLYLGTKTYYI